MNIGGSPIVLPKTDCVMALFNVVGYIPLWHIIPYIHLKKGHDFIFDCWDTKRQKEDPPRLKLKFICTNCYRISIPLEINRDNVMKMDYVIVDNDYSTVETHLVRSYTKDNVTAICDTYGYKIKDTKLTGGWIRWYKVGR